MAYGNGVGVRERRVDCEYGAPINDTPRCHVGGHARNGGGRADKRFDIPRGYRIKANVTRGLPDRRGFACLYHRRLDEPAPTHIITPSIATLDGTKVTGFAALPGFDGRGGSSRLIYAGGVRTAEVTGFHSTLTEDNHDVTRISNPAPNGDPRAISDHVAPPSSPVGRPLRGGALSVRRSVVRQPRYPGIVASSRLAPNRNHLRAGDAT